jgi:DNA-binding response OmpR family regulator
MKKHILLIEKEQNKLDFFAKALAQSSPDFFCSVAKSKEQAARILRHIVPDIILINFNATDNMGGFLQDIDCVNSASVVLYTDRTGKRIDKAIKVPAACLQLPGDVRTMGFILHELLIN